MEAAPKGVRLQVGIFGRANTGKSSLLNYAAGQDVAITSPVAGTTTDVVEKAMELLPLGPVLFLDTAGLDDASVLGSRRRQRTLAAFRRCDVVLLVLEAGVWTQYEEEVAARCRQDGVPLVMVVNKTDAAWPSAGYMRELQERSRWVLSGSCRRPGEREAFMAAFKAALLQAAPEHVLKIPPLVSDLLPAGGLALFVVPIDMEAPKGRIILPQVQAIRDALDADAGVLVVKENGLVRAWGDLRRAPDLVVCDSQAVGQVAAEVPAGVPCTTFSILFARAKGDLVEAARAAARISGLRAGDRVLVAEACSHHALADDIGRVKIPRWLKQATGVELCMTTCSGRDFPQDLAEYKLVIHCGACTLNRREMLSRLRQARLAGVPVTNYGVAIAAMQGVAARVLEPFPAARAAFLQAQESGLVGRCGS
ncbi:MAG: [FeFe] hydrogenase H-cluster maturation GTPase HydF [Elusimicrobiota bacterium]|jgi:[FeFe] hydrogenase H-cluster maturation GTPase HydF